MIRSSKSEFYYWEFLLEDQSGLASITNTKKEPKNSCQSFSNGTVRIRIIAIRLNQLVGRTPNLRNI